MIVGTTEGIPQLMTACAVIHLIILIAGVLYWIVMLIGFLCGRWKMEDADKLGD